jgi:hypothetical protein
MHEEEKEREQEQQEPLERVQGRAHAGKPPEEVPWPLAHLFSGEAPFYPLATFSTPGLTTALTPVLSPACLSCNHTPTKFEDGVMRRPKNVIVLLVVWLRVRNLVCVE